MNAGLPKRSSGTDGRFRVWGIALFVFITLSCAKEGRPPGGPVDDKPPVLAGSQPEHMSTAVPRDGDIYIEFDEAMDEGTVEENLFIVPIPAEWPRLSWRSRGRVLVISPVVPLLEETTYVVSVGAKAQDRRRNTLDETITVMFSTGDVIENGRITGNAIPYHVFGEDREDITGLDVVAYRLDAPGEEPDPRMMVPDYYTQTGSDGTYEMTGLSSGTYRLMAIGDEDGNGFYSEGRDLIGISPFDVTIARNDSIGAPAIAVSSRDTSMVQIRSLRAPDGNRVELFFDREIAEESVELTFDGLEIFGWFISPGSSGTLSVATEAQTGDKRYPVKSLSVRDTFGNELIPIDFVLDFAGSDRPDTTALEIVHQDASLLPPGNRPVSLTFNRMLRLPGTDGDRFAISHESGDIIVRKTAENALELLPDGDWEAGTTYTVALDSAMVKGIAGNVLSDSSSVVTFRVAPADTLGYISGHIEDEGGDATSRYVFRFKNIDVGLMEELTHTGKETWKTGGILPGRYVATAFRDINGDGTQENGYPYPYHQPEPAVVLPDTIEVVARWTKEDILFAF